MIYSLSEIETVKKSEEENREKLRAEIKEYNQKILEGKELMRAAACAGRIEEYQERKEAVTKLETALEATKEFYEATKNDSVITKEDIFNTWDEYAKKYNKKFDKVFAEYEKARKETAQKYYELVHMMTMALECMEKCADFAGIKTGAGCGWDDYKECERGFIGKCHKLDQEPACGSTTVVPTTEYGQVNLPSLVSMPILYFLTHGDISNDQAVECCWTVDRGLYQSHL